MVTKITNKAGAEVTVNTASFFHAITRSASAVNDTVLIDGVPYTLSTVRFILTGGATVIADVDYSANPNYLAANAGDIYRGSVAGRVGGALGKQVGEDDLVMCIVTSAAGTEAAVGANWVVIANKTANQNLIIVDSANGSDTMGVKYNPQRPFATITAAEAVAVAGDVIMILPGTYTSSGHGAAGGTFVCEDGVIFNSASGVTATFETTAAAQTLRVTGKARFIGSDQALSFSSVGGNVFFEFESSIQTSAKVIQLGDYDTCYLSGKQVTHTLAGGGGINGCVSFNGNTSATSTGYFNIDKITSNASIGVVTILETNGKLYGKVGSIVGSPQGGGACVLISESGANGVDLHLDAEYIENSTLVGAGVVSHCIYADTVKNTTTINCKTILNSNGFDGASGFQNNAGVAYLNVSGTCDSPALAIVMIAGTLKAQGVFQHRGALVFEAIRHTAGTLRFANAYIKNYAANAGGYGIAKAGGTLILDDVTIVTDAASESVYAGAAQNVKVYSLYANTVMDVNITDLVGGTLIVDTDVE